MSATAVSWSAPAQEPAGGNDEELVEPPWPRDLAETFRTFFERVDVEELAAGVPTTTPAVLPTLESIAAGLPRTLDGPFRFVQDQVRFEAYAGSIRGAAGALAAGAGNSVDQALLLADLYRRVGRRSRLVRGSLRWRDAVALVGPRSDGLPERGDPWLRRVEAAAEHWWVEVEDGGRWRSLDPVFATTSPGEEVGQRRDVLDELPLELRATASIALRRGGEELTRIALPVSALIGRTLRVDAGDPSAAEPAEIPDIEAREESDAAERSEPTAAAILAELLPPTPDLARPLVLSAAGRERATRVLSAEERATVDLFVEIDMPVGSGLSMRLPLGSRSVLRVAIGSGAVGSAHLAALAGPLHERYRMLTETEVETLLAWQARPQEPTPDPAVPLAPPPPPPWPVTAADGERMHPSIRLVEEAIAAWRAFDGAGMEMLSWVVLAAGERIPLPAGAVRMPLRISAIRWRPPAEALPGSITVWVSDGLADIGGDGGPHPGFQSAFGMLQSAVVGQVLNRVADRPPTTAFDVTLRAVGTGGRLGWWGTAPSPDLPAVAFPVAQADLAAGRWLAGTTGGRTGAAWWATVPRTGFTASRVVTGAGVAQAEVAFGDAMDMSVTESLLASLPDLHAGVRWLLSVADPASGSLEELVPGACAGAPLVRELMRAGAPEAVTPPAFELLC